MLAAGQATDSSSRVAVHGGDVYWSLPGGNGIMTAPTTGGVPGKFAASSTLGFLFALGRDRVYWEDGGALRAKSFWTGSPTVTLGQTGALGAMIDLVPTVDALYWTVGANRGFVQKLGFADGATSIVYMADDDVGDLALAADGNSLYWMNEQSFQDGRPQAGRLMKAPLGGGDPVVVTPAALETRFVVVDATSVYFPSRDRGDILRITPK